MSQTSQDFDHVLAQAEADLPQIDCERGEQTESFEDFVADIGLPLVAGIAVLLVAVALGIAGLLI